MPKTHELPSPMMRRTTGFHDHSCWRLTCKEDGQLILRQPVVLVDMARGMRDSNFKNGLCHVDGDGRMLHGTPPDVWFLGTDRDDFGTSMPFKSPGGVHFISCGTWSGRTDHFERFLRPEPSLISSLPCAD